MFSPPRQMLAMLGVAWTVTNACIHQSQQRHRCRKSGSASIICWQWWKKSPQKATPPRLELKTQVNQSRKEVKMQKKLWLLLTTDQVISSVKTSARILCYRAPSFTSNQACRSLAGPLGVPRNTWESCGHTLRAAADNVWLWYVWAVGELLEIPPVPTALLSNWPLTGTIYTFPTTRYKQYNSFQHLPVSWRVISTSQVADSEEQFLVLLLSLSPRVWQPKQIPPEII